MTTTISLEAIEEIHFEATVAAEQAAAKFFQEKLGGQDQMPAVSPGSRCLKKHLLD